MQAPLNRMGLSTDRVAGLNILIDGIQHALCHGADTGMPMTLRMTQKGHVVGIEMQGIDQRERFIMQRKDIGAEPPAGLAYPGTQGQPAGGA